MGKTILLVDDEVEITDIHQRYLVQAEYQVLVAHDDYYRYHDASDGWL